MVSVPSGSILYHQETKGQFSIQPHLYLEEWLVSKFGMLFWYIGSSRALGMQTGHPL